MSAEPVMRETEQSLAIPSLPKVGYSMKEAQKITGLGKTTLWEAIAKGELKCFRVGRRTLFSLKHLEDFMALYETDTQSIKLRRRKKSEK